MEKFEYLYLAIVFFVTGLTVSVLLLWELIRSQLRFRAICENSGNMVVIGRAVTNSDKKIVDVEIVGCNEVYASHQGMSVKDVTGLYIVKNFFNGLEPEWFNVLRGVIITRESRHLEFVYEPLGTRYSGSVFCLSTFRKRCCFIMDEVSEEYNRQRELESNRQKLVYTLRQSRTGLCRWDIVTDKVSFDDDFWRSVGGENYDAAMVVPDTMEQLLREVIPDDPKAVADWARKLREGDQIIDEFYFRCQMTFLRGVWLEVRNFVLERDESGKPLVVSAFVINITEIRLHEQALLAAMREADEAGQAKNRFLTVMSHEIRTPLNAIIGFSSIIKRADISGQLQSYAESIRSSGEMLLTLINDLLDLAKMESDKMRLNLQSVNLYNLLNELRDMFALKVQAKGLYLNIFCPDNLPLFNLDTKRIKQVLINLVGNASKFTNMGGITITINCEPCESSGSMLERRQACRLIISVKDTGEGILKQDFGSIFNPFEQAAGRRGEYVEGSGLGLSICKNLVELMGGRITCASEVGVGSEFVVSLDCVGVDLSDTEKMNEDRFISLSEKRFNASGIDVKSELHQTIFAGLIEKFGDQFVEMQNGMHVRSAQILAADLQQWISQYEVPQIQMIINSLAKAVEECDVAEVKRLSKFLIQKGSGNGA